MKAKVLTIAGFVLFVTLMTHHIDHSPPAKTYPSVTVPVMDPSPYGGVPAFTRSHGRVCIEARTPGGQLVTPYYAVDGGYATLPTGRYTKQCSR